MVSARCASLQARFSKCEAPAQMPLTEPQAAATFGRLSGGTAASPVSEHLVPPSLCFIAQGPGAINVNTHIIRVLTSPCGRACAVTEGRDALLPSSLQARFSKCEAPAQSGPPGSGAWAVILWPPVTDPFAPSSLGCNAIYAGAITVYT